jgi:hypothetical protein
MAIQLTATLVDEFSFISSMDEAVDRDADDFEEKYVRYREGTVPMPPLKEGVEPTVFKLKPIACKRMLAKIRGIQVDSGNEAALIAAAIGGVKGWTPIADPERPGKHLKCTPVRDDDGFECLPDNIVDKFPYALLLELGGVIISHGTASED